MSHSSTAGNRLPQRRRRRSVSPETVQNRVLLNLYDQRAAHRGVDHVAFISAVHVLVRAKLARHDGGRLVLTSHGVRRASDMKGGRR